MKNIIKTFSCFVLFFIFGKEEVNALVPMPEIRKDIDINIVSTATPIPTSILIKPIKDLDIDIKPLATKTPTPVIVTQVVTATPNPTVSVTNTKPTETIKTEVTPAIVETETAKPTIEEVVDTEDELEKTDSDKWFWGVIIGLLALILAIQVWSTRKNEKNQSKKENE